MRDRIVKLALVAIISSSVNSAAAEPGGSFEWSSVSTDVQKAEYIGKQLKAWRSEPDAKGKKLRVVYFRPQDREPLSQHQQRWHDIMADIQDFYRVEMKRLGFGPLTLGLELQEGKLQLHDVVGTAPDDGTYTYRSGGRIRQEVFRELAKRGIDAGQETLLIVCGLSKTDGKKVTIYSPYYGMGADHQRGICFVADSDWLKIDGLRPQQQETTLQVKEHRGFEPFSLARFNTTYIGGTIHELGHGLSLPHNHATPAESAKGTALMGAGNYTYRQEWRDEGKGSFLTMAHAIRLAVHPLFSETTQQSAVEPELRLQSLDVEAVDSTLRFRGQLQSRVPAIGVIAYDDVENKGQRGFQVNNDYDATTWTSVVNPAGEFRIRIDELRPGKHQIRLVVVHANGATVTHRLHYTMEDGKPDLKQMKSEIDKAVSRS